MKTSNFLDEWFIINMNTEDGHLLPAATAPDWLMDQPTQTKNYQAIHFYTLWAVLVSLVSSEQKYLHFFCLTATMAGTDRSFHFKGRFNLF